LIQCIFFFLLAIFISPVHGSITQNLQNLKKHLLFSQYLNIMTTMSSAETMYGVTAHACMQSGTQDSGSIGRMPLARKLSVSEQRTAEHAETMF
ncbi:hypothetical protein, partial [Marvinbryantia sp.]|uniref:hypothetical protein n=1 Tax=Marvinbryantia sp. TaxID=2496532 RepID=UPI003A959293